ncbi:FecR family protein [Chitinophaga qingshengii]|uniref:FecR family protein n=1 Tax=Chitinophaga qingshengii TaxID=1569794 RepID=A0ABR7TNM9_9BACT|nr:FecR family protein [Chitinophaga qingshengii]MBC9931121.1 FecR family protein [Chitinophaga qingshengii]
MTKDQRDQFLQDYAAGNYSQEQYAAFRQWLAAAGPDEQLEVLDKYSHLLPGMPELPSLDLRRIAMIEEALDEAESEQRPAASRVISFRRWWAAAAILVLLGAGTALIISRQAKPQPVAKADFPPGRDGAVLTLGDGSQIVLDSLGNGIVATQNGASIVLHNGKIGYDRANGEPAAPQYNTLTTPVGRQFKVMLPDGTIVWLNAKSSIRFPTYFMGDDRTVDISGEVYLEVAQDVKHPFKVNIRRSDKKIGTVEVLGTYFNINAYPDENSCRVTLVQGAVMVSAGTTENKTLLKPDQQANISPDHPISVLPVNTESAIAWKNGYFDFEDNDLTMLARQLSRWYGIDTKVMENAPDAELGGKINRNLALPEMIKVLNQAGVHCRLENNKTIVFIP